jgi:hypothetical protein
MSKSRFQGSGISDQTTSDLFSPPYSCSSEGPEHLGQQSACRLSTGGADRDRTGDPLLAKQVLSQLSYGPKVRCQIPDIREQML